MTNVQETRSKVEELLASKFPTSGRARVDVKESFDSDGEPSFKIRVIFPRNPSPDELRYQRSRLIDELRTWLSKNGDDRFPYVSFTTEQDEKEKELIR